MNAATRRQTRATVRLGGAVIGALLVGAVLMPDHDSMITVSDDHLTGAAVDACVSAISGGSAVGSLAYEYLTQASPASVSGIYGATVYEDGSARIDCGTVLWDMSSDDVTVVLPSNL